MDENEFSRQLLALLPDMQSFAKYLERRTLTSGGQHCVWTAEDLAQETYYKALKNWSMFTYMGEGSLWRWCKTMMRNMAINKVVYLQESRMKVMDHVAMTMLNAAKTYTTPQDELEDRIDTADKLRMLYKAIDSQLTDRQAICLLYSLDEGRCEDTSRELGITSENYREASWSGRAALRKHFGTN